MAVNSSGSRASGGGLQLKGRSGGSANTPDLPDHDPLLMVTPKSDRYTLFGLFNGRFIAADFEPADAREGRQALLDGEPLEDVIPPEDINVPMTDIRRAEMVEKKRRIEISYLDNDGDTRQATLHFRKKNDVQLFFTFLGTMLEGTHLIVQPSGPSQVELDEDGNTPGVRYFCWLVGSAAMAGIAFEQMRRGGLMETDATGRRAGMKNLLGHTYNAIGPWPFIIIGSIVFIITVIRALMYFTSWTGERVGKKDNPKIVARG